jgi:ATP-binding cassette, subfamily C, bacteriocin exporter
MSLLQHDSTDCGAACLASVIRFFGGNSSIERIRKASGTSQYGTTLLGLCQAAQQLGIDAKGYEANIEDIIDYENILILHIEQDNGTEHYVVCYGYKNEKFIIWDPAKGLAFYSRTDLDKLWRSKKCLGLIPGENFQLRNDERKEKWKWIISSLKPDKEILMVSVFLGIIISVLGLAMAIFTKKLIDEIIPSGKILLLITISVLVLILLSSKILFTSFRQYFLLSQGKNFNIRVVNSFYSALLFLPKSFFDTRKTGDFVARLNDTMRIQRVISDLTSIYVIDSLVLFLTLSLIFFYSKVVALFSLAALPVLFLIVYRKNRQIINLQYDAMAGYAVNESNFISSLKGITEIKCLNWHKAFSDRNNYIFSDFQERAVRLGRLKISLGLLTSLAGTFYLIIVLVYSATEVMHSKMTIGELMAILTLSSSLLPSILNLSLFPVPFNEAKVAISRMFEFTQIENEEKFEKPANTAIAFDKIVLKDVAFRFPGQKLLLKDINISVEKGRMIALVGESGSGKSTLANIIMKFYLPESGGIFINNRDSCEKIQLSKWRSAIGLVPQDVNIFNATVLENIIGDVNEEKLKELTSLVTENNLESFFEKLPAGFATVIGEEGVKLSGGQKQVIAFLRALMQKPDILLIDEGTSNMDRDSELTIIGILQKIKMRTGILLITHRINLIKQICDYIYILDKGTISVFGTHSELLKSENIYKKFWEDFE